MKKLIYNRMEKLSYFLEVNERIIMDKLNLYETILSKGGDKYKVYLEEKHNIPIKKESILNHLKEKFREKEVPIFLQSKLDNIQTLNSNPVKKEHIYKTLLINDIEILDSLFICEEKGKFSKIEYKNYKQQKLKEVCYYDEDYELDYDYEYDEDSEEKLSLCLFIKINI